MDTLQALLDEGVAERIFPAAQAVVFHKGKQICSLTVGGANEATLFDLGSITKVICTTSTFMSLWAAGKLEPETPLSRFFPRSPASLAGVTLRDLLYHRSGLPAFVPYFAKLMPAVPALFDPHCPANVRMEARTSAVDAASQQPLVRPPRTAAVYSDVGMILMGEVLTDAGSDTLDRLYEDRVASKLGVNIHFRRLSAHARQEPSNIAPSGSVRPREPAPGQEGLWPVFPAPKPSRAGEVDDDNAWVMDGVSGHAGLFGTALEVARFGQRVLEEAEGAARIASPALWKAAFERDAATPESTRALGFDTPSATDSSAGQYLGRPGPAVGHLGFAGVSLWVDFGRKLSVSLCTNRTFFGRANTRIKEFRPRFHDLVAKTIDA